MFDTKAISDGFLLKKSQRDCGLLKSNCEANSKLSRCMKMQRGQRPLVQMLLTAAREPQLAVWLGCYTNTSKMTAQTQTIEM